MRRASFLLSPLRRNRGRADLMERARSPFGAPPRHPRFFRPRLGSGRASWNHRMQTGGPSPAPVQRAPRSPARAGRDDAQAARERSVSPRPREPLPLRPKEYPRERRPSRAGFWLGNRNGDRSQGQCRFIGDGLVGVIRSSLRPGQFSHPAQMQPGSSSTGLNTDHVSLLLTNQRIDCRTNCVHRGTPRRYKSYAHY